MERIIKIDSVRKFVDAGASRKVLQIDEIGSEEHGGSILSPIKTEQIFESFLSNLGFILANDHCRRNCLHCPAYGDKSPIQNMPFKSLSLLVNEIAEAYREQDRIPSRTIASWRISDPLDYHVADGGAHRSTYDVAKLWKERLGQGLYLVTNGSEGRAMARRALERLASEPILISQAKLTITPFDAYWGTKKYFDDICWDVKTLSCLWGLQSQRMEDPHGSRFRINAKTTDDKTEEVRQFIRSVLYKIGFSEQETSALLNDPKKIAFKPIYDLGTYSGDDTPIINAKKIKNLQEERHKPTEDARTRYQFAIFPDGSMGIVDMYAFQVYKVLDSKNENLHVNLP
jgi:hypothetical protein